MAPNTPAGRNDSNKNVTPFQFSDTYFRDFVKRERPSLQLEKVYTAPKYEGIEEHHPIQREMTKALFRSKLYPDITAESEIDIKKHIEDSARRGELEDAQESISSRLSSSGHRALQKKELGYKAAIVKQDLKTRKKQRLEDNNLTLKDVSVEENYVYYVTLYNKTSNTIGRDHGRTPEEACEKALIEIHRNEEQHKKWLAKVWKEDPEFMYMKTEYDEILSGLGYFVFTRSHNTPGEYTINLSGKGSFSENIHAVGSSRKEAFEEVIEAATIAHDKQIREKQSSLNVTHMSINSIVDILESGPEAVHEVYKNALYNEISMKLETGDEMKFTQEQVEEYKKHCIDTEQYEMALKADNYLKQLD